MVVVAAFYLWSILEYRRTMKKGMVRHGGEGGRCEDFPIIAGGRIRETFGERWRVKSEHSSKLYLFRHASWYEYVNLGRCVFSIPLVYYQLLLSLCGMSRRPVIEETGKLEDFTV
jgi:hypothetical protein